MLLQRKEEKQKNENRISMNRPTIPMNAMVLTSYEMDPRKLHGRTEDQNCLQRSVSESKEDARSFPSSGPQTMCGSFPSSAKYDKVSKIDIHILDLIAIPLAKKDSWEIKEQLQDYKVPTKNKNRSTTHTMDNLWTIWH